MGTFVHLLFPLLAVLPNGLSEDSTIAMEHGVEYVGAHAPAQAEIGGEATYTFYFKVDGQLPDAVKNFLHVEPDGDSDCRIVHDRKPTNYTDGLLAHEVTVSVPGSDACSPQTLDVFTGLYDTKTSHRYRIAGITTPDNRIPAASLELVASGASANTAPQVWAPSDIHTRRIFRELRPWWGWIGGLVAALLVLIGLRRWLPRDEPSSEDDDDADEADAGLPAGGLTDPIPADHWAVRLGLGLVAVPAILSILAALDFVKDDAYISFRYAHNLVTGHGLVFNPGEYVEGFTNFLWTLLMAPFEAMGLDLFQVVEILGPALVLGMLAQLAYLGVHLMDGTRRDMAHLWAPTWLATSSSVALWTTSGMEQPLAMLLPVSAAYLLWTCWDDEDAVYRAAASGVLMGLGCMTRPEIHLIGILVGLPLVWRCIRDRRLDPIAVYWSSAILGIVIPFHLFRIWYYGGLLPNTFYVKTGGSTVVLLTGLDKLHDMFWFNGMGVLALLAPLAFVDRKHLREKLIMLAVAAGFMFYVVWVGDDEMKWHRLYLPALPFLVMLATLGLRNLCGALAAFLTLDGWKRLAVYLVGWGLVLGAGAVNFSYTYNQMSGFNGRGPLQGTWHPDIGKFLTRHADPGSLVAFQDMGSTPYHAPDLKFLDFIGLVDHTVAHARHDYGLHAFVSTGTPEIKAKYDAEMREYFYERSPEWVILTSYIPGYNAGRVSEAFGKRPVPETLEPYIGTNTYQFDIYNEKFKENYVHVRTWPRSSTYYLSLFQRRDTWEKPPGEVVLDEKPGDLGGVTASFEGGLELIGSDVQAESTERHHVFVTTWWELPGPMKEDLNFFLHLEKPDIREPYDHRPGDWVYPANRWKEGQILEDRTLFQLPPSVPPGTYDLYMGAYHRQSGQRLAIEQGPNDGNNRLKLGTVKVTSWTPLWDHIIRPTRLDRMRKHPDRIAE